LPWVDEDTRVEHRVDVRAEWVLLFEVRLVDYTVSVHTKELFLSHKILHLLYIMYFLVCSRWEKIYVSFVSAGTVSPWTLGLDFYNFIGNKLASNPLLSDAIGHEILDNRRP